MEEMLNYVFNTLQKNEKNINALKRVARYQNGVNYRMAAMIGCMFYCMYSYNKKQKKQMQLLAKEIDDVKDELREGE